MTKLLLTAAVLALAGVAHAAPAVDNDTPSRPISTQGVNFNDAAQVRQFYVRLQSAARAVCQSGSDDQVVAGTEDISCIRRNMNDVVRQVGAPRLTAMLNNSYGHTGAATAFAADAR